MDNNIPDSSGGLLTSENALQDSPQRKWVGFNFFKNKIILIAIGFVTLAILVIIGLFLYLNSQSKEMGVVKESPKTWQIVLSYDQKENKFNLKELQLLDKEIVPDYRSAKFSGFTLKVVDNNENELYSSRVPLMKEIIDTNMLMDPPPEFMDDAPLQGNINNVLYAPHFENESHIMLFENETKVLDLVVPSKKKASIAVPKIKQAYAETCAPLKVVFISDGYSDFNEFHSDVAKFKDTFANTDPYNSKSGMFEFLTIDNSKPIGCSSQGLLYCMQYNSLIIENIARSEYPDFSKAVVIANAPELNPRDRGVAGISSGLGGSYAAFPNNFGGVTNQTLTVARHELLGHTVGLLYDRYVVNSPKYGLLERNIRSNCTDKSEGELFWADAGSTSTIKGCGNAILYAPSAPLCPKPANPQLISGGTPTSVMSAVGCGGTEFDAVEKLWIKQQILPDYIGCSGSSSNTAPTSSQSNPTPTPVPVSSNQIKGIAFIDSNSNNTYDAGEVGKQDVEISITGAANLNTLTNNAGSYSFSPVPAGDFELTAKLFGNLIGKSIFNIPSGNIYEMTVNIPILENQQANPTPIVIQPSTATPTPTSSSNSTPAPTQSSFAPNGTPTPTPEQYFTCKPDPKCINSGKSIQLCPLVCTPK